jgi:ABC-type Zn uptake system ZnuABC Zn-binding protein ZnuA
MAGTRSHCIRFISPFLVLIASALVGPGCGEQSSHPSARQKPVIVASIFPLADLTHQLVGDEFEIVTLLPPGSSPHGFELTPDRLRALHRASAVVVVGLDLDRWAQAGAQLAGPNVPLLRFSDLVGIDPHLSAAGTDEHDADEHAETVADEHAETVADEHADHDPGEHAHDHAGPNPHLWLDPVLTIHFVEQLRSRFIDLFPEHRERLEQRTETLLASLRQIDAECRQQLSAVPNKQLVTFHNAFDLFAQRYGLQVVAHLTQVELSPGGEVTPSHLVEAIDAIRRYQLKAVYAEPQFPDAAVQAIVDSTGVIMLRLDPLEGGTFGTQAYQKMLRSNLAVLVRGQSLTNAISSDSAQ